MKRPQWRGKSHAHRKFLRRKLRKHGIKVTVSIVDLSTPMSEYFRDEMLEEARLRMCKLVAVPPELMEEQPQLTIGEKQACIDRLNE